jgi:sugar phosphate permease
MITTQPSRRIYYGWILVVALAVTEMVSYGVLAYVFTVFVKPIQAELHFSSVDISGAYSVSLIVSALVGIPLGRWLDKHGPRWSMTAGSIVGVVLVLLWSSVHDLTAFYVIWFALGVVKAMVLYDPAFWVIANWFTRRRRQALTLLTFIAGFSSLIFIPLAQFLVGQFGWRGALVILALLMGVLTIPPHLLMLRRRPADMGLNPDGEEAPPQRNAAGTSQPESISFSVTSALRSSVFWWLTVAFAFNNAAVTVIAVYLVPYLTDVGHDAAFAALAAGLIGAVSLPGRIIFTLSGSRWSPGGIAALLFALQALGLIVLLDARSQASVLLFVALYGSGFGAITPARAGLVADFFGHSAYGAISSTLGFFVTAVSATASVAASTIIDRTHSYTGILGLMIIACGFSAVTVLLATYAHHRQVAAAEPA